MACCNWPWCCSSPFPVSATVTAINQALYVGSRKLGGELGENMLDKARGTVMGVMLGIVGTAAAQGTVAMVGFLIAGVPEAVLLCFVATFFLSMIPIGPPLIWGGAAIWLYSGGRPAGQYFMVLYGLFVISSIDNFVKPILIARGAGLSILLIALGVLGGVLVFGFIGIFLGPVLLALGDMLPGAGCARNRPYDRNRQADRSPAAAERIIAPQSKSAQEEALERALRRSAWPTTPASRKSANSWKSSFMPPASAARGARPCAALRPAGPGQDHAGPHRRRRNGRQPAPTSGPVLERAGDLAAILTNLEPHDVLFIDEIHRLSPVVEEILYPALEDFQIDIMIGEGPAARSVKLDLPPFTLVGATTRAGMLTNPLRDRFGIVARLEFYNAEELQSIVTRSASCSMRPSTRKVRWKSPGARAARRASPTACCAACAITPRSRPTAASPAVADQACTCSTSIRRAST